MLALYIAKVFGGFLSEKVKVLTYKMEVEMNNLFSIEGLIFVLGLASAFSIVFWGVLRLIKYQKKLIDELNNTNIGKIIKLSTGKQFLCCLGLSLFMIFIIVISDSKGKYLSMPFTIVLIYYLFKKNK